MAYNLKYFYYWKNLQNDIFKAEILQDGFMGDATELQATATPFSISPLAGDNNIYSPIKPTAATIGFWSKNSGNEGDSIPAYSVSINDFYADADNSFRFDIYNSVVTQSGAIPINGEILILKWSGFIQIDNSNKEVQDYAVPISLDANDNLGLLQQVTFVPSAGIYDFYKLTDIMATLLQATTLQLNCNAYLNIFENTTDDRSIVDTNDFLQQTVIPSNYLTNNDGTFKDCYTILAALCHDFGMTLTQGEGAWQLYREDEFRLFTNGLVPGTQYDYQFNILKAITSPPFPEIGPNEQNSEVVYPFEPINVNQNNRILRPYVSAKRTLTYENPQWIDDQTFILLGNLFTGPGATLYPGLLYANVEYIGWEVPNSWYNETAFIACLVTAYDTTLDNTEIDRFLDILTLPGGGSTGGGYKWVQFNPIPVVAKAKLNYSFDFFAFWTNHTGPIAPIPARGDFPASCRIQLLTPSGDLYNLKQDTGSGINTLFWDAPDVVANWNNFHGLTFTGQYNGVDVPYLTTSAIGGANNWDLSSFDDNGNVPVFPADGVLLIGMAGNNNPGAGFYDCGIRNISCTIDNNLGAISSMVGQFYKQTQANAIKNNSDESVDFADTIVNTIKGTLLTSAQTNYGIWVNNFYSTKTYSWHRAALTEALKLQQINTFDTLFIQRIARLIIEGDFFGLWYRQSGGVTGVGNIGIDPPIIEITGRANADGIEPGMLLEFAGELYKVVSVTYDSGLVKVTTDPTPSGPDMIGVAYSFYWPKTFISLINILKISFFEGKNFIIGIGSFDYRSCVWNATMYELYDDGEVDGDLSAVYQFSYLFQSK